MVRTLKDAIILSKLKEKPRTIVEIAISMNIGKTNISKSLSRMKRSGLVNGRGQYFLTYKGRAQHDYTIRKISGF